MTKRVVVVFEEVPESTKLFVIDATDEEVGLLRSFHGQFIGSVETDEEMERKIESFFYNEGRLKHVPTLGPVADAALVVITGTV